MQPEFEMEGIGDGKRVGEQDRTALEWASARMRVLGSLKFSSRRLQQRHDRKHDMGRFPSYPVARPGIKVTTSPSPRTFRPLNPSPAISESERVILYSFLSLSIFLMVAIGFPWRPMIRFAMAGSRRSDIDRERSGRW